MTEDSNDDAPVVEPVTDEPIEHIRDDRFRVIDLQWPVRYQGRVIDKVTVRRLTSREVADYVGMIRFGGERVRFPMTDLPDNVIDALDDADADAIDQAMLDFFVPPAPAFVRQHEPGAARRYIAFVAMKLNTPLPVCMAMDWHELLRWIDELIDMCELKVTTDA